MTTTEEAARGMVLDRIRYRLASIPDRLRVERMGEYTFGIRVKGGDTLSMQMRRRTCERFNLNGGFSKTEKHASGSYFGHFYGTSVSEGGGLITDVPTEVEIVVPNGSNNCLPGKEDDFFYSDQKRELVEKSNGGFVVFKTPEKVIMPCTYALTDLAKINQSTLVTVDKLAQAFKVTFNSSVLFGLDRDKACGEVAERKLIINMVEYCPIVLCSGFKLRAITGRFVHKVEISADYDVKPIVDGAENGNTTFLFKKIGLSTMK